MSVFAADPTPWFQDFTFWAIFFGTLGSSVAATWAVVRLIYRERVRRLQQDLRSADEALKNARRARIPQRDEMERQLTDAREEAERLRQDLLRAGADGDRLQHVFDALNRNLKVAQQVEGLTWRVRPTGGADFVPLSDRRTPIVAVLNLKGGVGKTTLAANLGAAFARTGWRVLLVDLDLQASLTSLFVTGEKLDQSSRERRLIQHYFEQSAAGDAPRFADFFQVSSEPRVELVGSADTLAYAELNLTVHWLLQPGKSDPRLILRGALHDVKRFDLVLIDCPPLLNVSCVNALAAADFLLIPVMPSKSATDRVRPMISWVRALRRNLNPDLKILGVVANRVYRATGMSAEEENLWSALRDQCHDSWGEPVPMCKTFIPQGADVRDAETERRPLKPKDKSFGPFKKLAAELAGRLPQSCRPGQSSGIRGQESGVSR